MVKLTKIYTRGGDKGQTSLSNGARIAKHDPRVEAYGTSDECNSVIGLAVLHAEGEAREMLVRIQNDLFDVGADLATPHEDEPKYPPLRVVKEQVERLEREIDEMNAELAPLNSFTLPGGSEISSWLHLGRTVARRAERRVTELMEADDTVNPLALQYLNRLSDHLFVASRYFNGKGKDDVLWVPGKNR